MRLVGLKRAQPKYIAFSCGTDSVALAHKLRFYKPTLLHFNHGLDGDHVFEDKAREFARDFGLNLEVGYAKSKYETGSVESWCREQRYDWLSQFEGVVLTAHTLDDSVESYLIRALKGSPHFNPIPILSIFGKAKVFRPMLLVNKQKVNQYLKNNDLSGYTTSDFLNLDTSKLRNWLRHKVIPIIKEREDVSLERVVSKIVTEQYKKIEKEFDKVQN